MPARPQLTEESTSKFAQAGGVRLHYNEAGTGAAVIMLHGGGPGASGWSNFQQNLGFLSESHRVLLVDLPGFGKSDYVPLKESLPTVAARAVRDLMDTLGIEQASLIGNSMGGATSVTFAIDYPDRIDKLILMGAAGFHVKSTFVPMPTEGLKVLNQVARNPTKEGMRRLIELMVYDSSFLTDELLEQRLQAALANFRPEAANAAPPPWRDFTQELGKVKAKSLIIWGRDDRVVPFDGCLGFLWALPDAELHVFSKCGHWAQFEHPDEFNRLVASFLGAR
jgi:pimeloyl-ACP methyl ester carboxylesterase